MFLDPKVAPIPEVDGSTSHRPTPTLQHDPQRDLPLSAAQELALELERDRLRLVQRLKASNNIYEHAGRMPLPKNKDLENAFMRESPSRLCSLRRSSQSKKMGRPMWPPLEPRSYSAIRIGRLPYPYEAVLLPA